MKTWDLFYNNGKENIFQKTKHLCSNRSLLFNILQARPKKILEVGTGTGQLALFLSHFIHIVVAIDNDKELIERCNKFYKRQNLEFQIGDAFDLQFKKNEFDVVFSQGLLEHFSDKEIYSIINQQIFVSRLVIFTVPSFYYGKKDFGNERLLKINDWKKILTRGYNSFEIKYCSYLNQRLNFKPTQIIVILKND